MDYWKPDKVTLLLCALIADGGPGLALSCSRMVEKGQVIISSILIGKCNLLHPSQQKTF